MDSKGKPNFISSDFDLFNTSVRQQLIELGGIPSCTSMRTEHKNCALLGATGRLAGITLLSTLAALVATN
ncbi:MULTISPECIES: hypothetical protein [Pseudomonas]|uniref:hypothetical protein n=1 Tax=Pseudomonas TaxID=286 RepID=UPI00159B8F25|nr:MULTISPECIES: hypothetical protein [Pseudomonas]MCF4979185.1 hypothetical protein [Pseudomonas gessardii]